MACPTCDHTMHCVGVKDLHDAGRIYWCPRCGTLKEHSVDDIPHERPPRLVARCREFAAESFVPGLDENLIARWHQLGVHESITEPKDKD